MNRVTIQNFIENGEIAASKKDTLGIAAPHCHEFYEIEYVISGDGDYTVDGERYSVGRGMFFLMTPANFHEVRGEGCRGYNVMFSERACDNELLARCIVGKQHSVFSVNEDDRAIFEAFFEELCKNQSSPLYSSCLLNAILHKILSYGQNDQSRPDYVARAILYLLGHFRENPSLCDVAAHVGYTPTYFSAVFKRDVGESYKEYLDRLRFDYAKKLIMSSRLSIVQICKESGFDDYPNFIRRFKARFSLSPGEMRQGCTQIINQKSEVSQ